MSTIKPIFLLADSQLLFWRDQGELFLGRIRALLDADVENAGRAPRAAYLGASNGDAPEFYQLFVAAMEQIGVHDCRQIPSQPDAEDLAFLAAADLLLLAGGEVRRGWDAFKAAGLEQKLVERYYGGALLIGLSAGAVQLGLKGWDETGERMSDMLRVVPFVVDVHDEPGWGRLLQAVPRAGEHARGFGIPSGGGAVYHPDYSVEPVRHPLVEVSQTENGLQQALLLPGQASEPSTPSDPVPPPDAATPGDPPATTPNRTGPPVAATSAAPAAVGQAAPPAAAAPAAPPAAGTPAAPPAAGTLAAPPAAVAPAPPQAAAGPAVPPSAAGPAVPPPAAAPAVPPAAGAKAASPPEAAGGPGKPAGAAPSDDLERERRELGYSIGADGVIEILPTASSKPEPVN